MKAINANPGTKIRWTKESKTFTGIVDEPHPSGAVVRIKIDGRIHAIAADREVRVVGCPQK